MTETQELKKRINDSGAKGVPNAQVRDDYEPIGDMLLRELCANGEYIQRKVSAGFDIYEWRIFNSSRDPYTK